MLSHCVCVCVCGGGGVCDVVVCGGGSIIVTGTHNSVTSSRTISDRQCIKDYNDMNNV